MKHKPDTTEPGSQFKLKKESTPVLNQESMGDAVLLASFCFEIITP